MQLARPVVLVVHGDPDTSGTLCDLLEQAECTAERVADGASALARLARGSVDLILLDAELPGLGGPELCRQLRAQDAAVCLPIIMLAPADEALWRAGLEAGVDDCLETPVDRDALLDRVRVWLRVRQRLAECQERLLREQERRLDLEEAALRAQVAQDEAVLAMARTASSELSQSMTLLVGLLELWEAGRYPPGSEARVRADLRDALQDLGARIQALSQVVRYEEDEVAGYAFLALDRAQQPREANRSKAP